ncbi:MAG: ACP S-malonyltransferase [bacterium]
MGKIAFVFPGQGSQSVGMGYDIYNESEIARNVYDRFNKILVRNLTKVCFEGPDEELKLTINTQPAILATSIAFLEVIKAETKIRPDYVCGHSLGEYAALYEAGVLDLDGTISAIAKRAELMGKSKGGAMAAVLGLSQEKVQEVVREASETAYVDVANYNTPEQIVITGSVEGVQKATEFLSAAGAKRVIPLAVSGAFHSAMMKDAATEFSSFVNELLVNDAKIPVITNVDAQETTSKAEFVKKMPQQIYSSVYWTQTVQKLQNNGVETVFEIGPGKVLAGLIKKNAPDMKVINISDSKSLHAFLESEQEL